MTTGSSTLKHTTPAKNAASTPAGLFTDETHTHRCWWCGATPEYRRYHDTEWGFPVADDRRLFEKICLEGFQAGLSWLTILNKRENFRSAFANFEAEQIMGFDDADVKRLLADAGIVRHAGKIASTINNAKRVIALRREFGSLGAYVWKMEPDAANRPPRITHEVAKAMPTSAASVALSKDLRKRGWSFVGPTTIYAFMRAMGLVNDDLEGCASRESALKAQVVFKPPRLRNRWTGSRRSAAPGSGWACQRSFRCQYLDIGKKFNAADRPLNPIQRVIARCAELVQRFLNF